MSAATPPSSAGSFAEVKAGEVLTKKQRNRRNQKAAQAARGADSGSAGEGSGTAAMAIAAKETGPSPGGAVAGAAEGRVPGPDAMAIAADGSGARSDAGLASDSSGPPASSASASAWLSAGTVPEPSARAIAAEGTGSVPPGDLVPGAATYAGQGAADPPPLPGSAACPGSSSTALVVARAGGAASRGVNASRSFVSPDSANYVPSWPHVNCATCPNNENWRDCFQETIVVHEATGQDGDDGEYRRTYRCAANRTTPSTGPPPRSPRTRRASRVARDATSRST